MLQFESDYDANLTSLSHTIQKIRVTENIIMGNDEEEAITKAISNCQPPNQTFKRQYRPETTGKEIGWSREDRE